MVADTAREQGMIMLWESPLEKLLITRVKARVLAVGGPQTEPGVFPEDWVVRLTAYSLFGLPYGQMVYTAQATYTNQTPNVWGVDLPVRMAGGPIALGALLILTITAGIIIWPRTQVKLSVVPGGRTPAG